MAAALGILLAACGDDDGAAGPDAADVEPADASGEDGALLEIQTYVGTELAPVGFVALQDGDGPWRVLASSDGVYASPIASGRYGGLVACGIDSTTPSLYVFHGTIAERRDWRHRCVVESPKTRVRVTVDGLTDGEYAGVAISYYDQTVSASSPTALLRWIEPGLRDVVVIGGDEPRVVVQRDVEVSEAEEAAVTLDLGDSAPLGPREHALSVSGDADASASVLYVTRRGTEVGVGSTSVGGYAAMPAAVAADGDLYWVRAGTDPFDGPQRWVWAWLEQPRDVAVELPQPFEDVAVVSAGDAPYLRPSLVADDGAADAYEAHFSQPSTGRFVHLFASREGLGGGAWTMPDLSGVPGWEDAWALRPGHAVEWDAFARVVEGPGSALDQLDLINGTQEQGSEPLDWDGRIESHAEARGVLEP